MSDIGIGLQAPQSAVQSNFQDVVDFQNKYGIEMAAKPTLLDMDMGNFRLRFLNEELDETVSAFLRKDLPEFFDGLLDLVYVAAGTSAIFGFDWWHHFSDAHYRKMVVVDPEYNLVTLDPTRTEISYVHDWARKAYQDVRRVPNWPKHDPFMLKVLDDLHSIINKISGGYLDDDLDTMAQQLGYMSHGVMATAVVCGLPWQAGWNAVHEANMKKVRVDRPENSKRGSGFDVVKPAGWTPPDIQQVLLDAGWEGRDVV